MNCTLTKLYNATAEVRNSGTIITIRSTIKKNYKFSIKIYHVSVVQNANMPPGSFIQNIAKRLSCVIPDESK